MVKLQNGIKCPQYLNVLNHIIKERKYDVSASNYIIQYYVMNERNSNINEREIDLIQLLLYLWDHVLIIFVVGMFFAGALGIYSVIRQKSSIGNDKAVFSAIIEQNHRAANNTTTETVLNSERNPIDGTCIVRGTLFIDYNLDNIEKNDNLDYNALMNRMQNDVNALMLSNNALNHIADRVNQKNYSDLEPIKTSELRWLLNVSVYGVNIIQYSVTDINENRALEIAKELSNYFIDNYSDYELFDEVRVQENPSVYANSIVKDAGDNVSKKQVIKYALVGACGGVFIVCCVFLFIYLVKDAIRTSDDWSYFNTKELGKISWDKGKRNSGYDRLAVNMSFINAEKVIFVPVSSDRGVNDMISELKERLKNIGCDKELICIKNIAENPIAILDYNNSDGIVLVAHYGNTKIAQINRCISDLENTKKTIFGGVLLDCKH